jgi:hypothetical protein
MHGPARLLRVVLLRSSAAAAGFFVVSAVAQVLPAINIETSCRASSKAVLEALGENVATVEACLNQEKAAREQIIKKWDTFARADRTLCINPKVYMPSYVEWLSCLETREHIRSFPKQ